MQLKKQKKIEFCYVKSRNEAKMQHKDLEEFILWVKTERKKLRLKAKEVAEKCNIPYSRYRAIESGSCAYVGEETRDKIKHFFQAAENMIINNNTTFNHGAIQTVYHSSSGVNDVISRVSSIIYTQDFEDKVDSVVKLLNIKKEDAAKIVLESLINNNIKVENS